MFSHSLFFIRRINNNITVDATLAASNVCIPKNLTKPINITISDTILKGVALKLSKSNISTYKGVEDYIILEDGRIAKNENVVPLSW